MTDQAEKSGFLDTPSGKAWRAYMDHVTPADAENCHPCRYASSPRQGCEDGRRLYDAYRLALVKPNRADQ